MSSPGEFRNNPNLRYYLILINGLGLGISLLPFLMIFVRDRIGLTDAQVGNYLLFRVSGMVILGYILFRISSRFIYKQVMVTNILLGALIPVLSMILIRFPAFFQYIFILNGFFFTSYKVAQDGILIEISEEHNRAFYASLAGAGNLSLPFFPLIAGLLMEWLGYPVVFLSISFILLLTLFAAHRLDCRKKEVLPENFIREI